MKTSAAGLAALAKEEGTVLRAYYDKAHVLTIGVGHVITQADRDQRGWNENTTITHDEAMALLAGDVAHAENAVNSYVVVPLTQHQFDSMVSLVYNIGTGALEKSDLLRKLNAGDYAAAAKDFEQWCHDVEHGQLVVDQELLARRKREEAMFLTPDAPTAEDATTQAEVAAVEQEFAQQEAS